ncbi:ABC transporter permease [Neorhodopirellula pilleata]|uniref:ABC-2 family transporter protein n=1 Tax=Neorhodopirellula pilleata TaxID=2714738 RepID=A0A5C5ZQ55_9BACT|nr:ABC transporter permease [Neorhodopirellula pilleata]TWT89215.1 hypothetical protein Pla100_56830 [Neorhodopirellula pilleata]
MSVVTRDVHSASNSVSVSRPKPSVWGHSAFGRLIWKDVRLVRSLWIAGLISVAVVFLILCLPWVSQFPDSNALMGLFIMIPTLVALGLPPMLIGTENEDRTLDWVRGLPISWRGVLASKALVAVSVWLSLAIIAILLWQVTCISRGIGPGQGVSQSHELVLIVLLCGASVMLASFVSSFIFRSPIYAALLVIPLMGGCLWLSSFIAWNLPPQYRSDTAFGCLALGHVATGVVILLVLAKRRLAGFCDQSPFGLPRSLGRANRVRPALATESTWVPTRSMAVGGRPPIVVSLLWQQVRQTRWVLAGCLAVAFAGTAYLGSMPVDHVFSAAIAPLALLFLATIHVVLGVTTFYGDRQRQRTGFFAERGISVTKVWWTRLLPSLLVSLVIGTNVILCMASVRTGEFNRPMPIVFSMLPTIFVSQLLLFSIGAAASQWGRKPTLSYLLAPFWTSLWCSPVFNQLIVYPEQSWTLWPAAVVWLFATWRLMPRLIEGQTGPGLWVRGLAYAMLAMGVISAGVFGSIWWTTPPAMPTWKAKTLSSEIPQLSAGLWDETEYTAEEAAAVRLRRPSFDLPSHYDFQPDFQDFSASDFRSLTSDQPAQMPKEIRISFAPADQESLTHWHRIASASRALRNATAARLHAAETGSLSFLLQVAEPSEREGLFWLQRIAKAQGLFEADIKPPASQSEVDERAAFVRLVGLIPSEQLRLQSRRIALLSDWKRFQSSPTSFAGHSFSDPRYRLGIEMRRVRRLIDQGTRTVLQQLETTLPSRMDFQTPEQIRLWKLAIYTPTARIQTDTFFAIPEDVPIFLIEHEELIARLQKAAEAL